MAKDIRNITKILAKHLKQLSKSSLEAFSAEISKLEAPKGCNQIQREQLEGKSLVDVADMIMKSYTIRHGPTKVIQALKNMNENQIRIDLQKDLNANKKKKKSPGEVKAAPRTGGEKVNVVDQKPNTEAEETSKPSTSHQPAEDIKPKIESDSMEKSPVKAQTIGGAAGHKRKSKEQSGEDGKPKITRKQSTSGKAADKKHFITENRTNLIKLMTHVEPVLDDLLEEKLLTQEQYDIIRRKNTNQDKMRELFDYVKSWGPKDNTKFQRILKKHNPVPIKNLLEKSKQRK
ncbi:baculoviral IAP repeat-containing protein 2-like [Dendropsophus ebraccatus]|uniref:baculoviral IAP repeat-containing protein 2-like n=1 Tax=Dendropsophus ebraccatus TaxID=150705 RepID=UPI0038318584